MPDKWDRKTGFCCMTCMYYVPKKTKKTNFTDPEEEEVGRCRRHSPTMLGYPTVYAQFDWCGDHKLGTNPSK